ncbi:EamA family transporter [Prosthecomicrobium sp. N25]|uniref:EamA family transporter n=1 Tax=Prosthecomicrobium sp. N25 TaxID=3129254 RepID=UPI0030789535
MVSDSLWIWLTLGAVGFQTLRNAMHRVAAATLPVASATTVRFIFALPFAAAFFAAVLAGTGRPPLAPTPGFVGFVILGAVVQTLGSGLMLLAMRERSFVVTIALTKTEPIQVALFGFVLMGERVGLGDLAGAALACAGVLTLILATGHAALGRTSVRPALLGLAAGGLFGCAAVAYRAAMLSLPEGPFFVRASETLLAALTLQAALMILWLRARQPGALSRMVSQWRLSLGVGGAGAIASQMWFAAYALQSATLVSILGLTEVIAANIASARYFREPPTRAEWTGIALLVAGVALALAD